jgi:hypothetical protein|tara:strand:- start:3315 stop:3740 length:426 start_codon:yes stop_codon:yes gene_type:complete
MPNFTPNEYDEKINDIELIFSSLQTDSEKHVSSHPDEETKTSHDSTYSEQLDELLSLQSQMFSDIEEVLQNINKEDQKISKYDIDNNILEQKYLDIRDKIQGAVGMKNDTQTLYNQEYYGNILIFLSIICGCVLYARTRRL